MSACRRRLRFYRAQRDLYQDRLWAVSLTPTTAAWDTARAEYWAAERLLQREERREGLEPRALQRAVAVAREVAG